MKKGKNYITFTLKLVAIVTMALILAKTAPAAWYKFDRTAEPTFKEEIIISPGETQKNILAFGSRVVVEGRSRKASWSLAGRLRSAERSAGRWLASGAR